MNIQHIPDMDGSSIELYFNDNHNYSKILPKAVDVDCGAMAVSFNDSFFYSSGWTGGGSTISQGNFICSL